jgi:hypothetical protein
MRTRPEHCGIAAVTLTLVGPVAIFKPCLGIEVFIANSIWAKNEMRAILAKIPYSVLIVLAVMLLLAPFYPMPHVVEKLVLLKNGELRRPIDIFDLGYHLTPLMVLVLKLLWDPRRRSETSGHR